MDAQQRWYADSIDLRGQVIADVGANVGALSQFFWEASQGTSRVVSIEPLMENVERIRARIRAAGAEGWTVEACAASGRRGTLGLALGRTPAGEPNGYAVRGRAARTVPCRTLSSLVPDATVVKLDVEGHEYAVLDEALERLGRAHTWAIELHRVPGRTLQSALGALMAQGYRVHAAARGEGDADAPWRSEEIHATLDWADVPPTRRNADGSTFRMLHVIATRPPQA